MILSKFSPFMFGVYFFTSTFLARDPSTPSIKSAIARQKKTKGKFLSIDAIRAKKLKKTPDTVKRCTPYERKTLKITLTLVYLAFYPSLHVAY